jgi:hypothetical protein
MRHFIAAAALVLLTACASSPRVSDDIRKAPCDRISAQAIQSSSLEDAKNLAAQASECYASAQSR